MANKNTPPQNPDKLSTAEQDELQSILDEIDSLPDGDLETDDEREAGDYPRYVVIDLPEEAAAEWGLGEFHVSKRRILEWFAADRPEEAGRVLGLRDSFFAGDHEEDYYLSAEPATFMRSEEERAVARVARAATRPERDRKRRELEREHQDDLAARRAHDAKINAMWLPFAEEQRALDVEKEALRKRWAKLPDEWDRFVIERETSGDDRAIREAAERARLEAIENELKAELGKIDQKMFELADRVHKAARPKAA